MGNLFGLHSEEVPDDNVYIYKPKQTPSEEIHLGLAEKVFCAEKSQSRRERRRYNKSKYKIHPLAPRE